MSSSSAPVSPALRKPFTGIVLGIDPSLRGCGLAVVSFEAGGRMELLAHQTLKQPSQRSLAHCLGAIHRGVAGYLVAYPQTSAVALEQTIYVQNVQTAQILGSARGAAISAAALANLPVFEYPPLRIKQAVVGFGRASKEQLARQVQALLRLETAMAFDESDAAGVAICHALTSVDSI